MAWDWVEETRARLRATSEEEAAAEARPLTGVDVGDAPEDPEAPTVDPVLPIRDGSGPPVAAAPTDDPDPDDPDPNSRGGPARRVVATAAVAACVLLLAAAAVLWWTNRGAVEPGPARRVDATSRAVVPPSPPVPLTNGEHTQVTVLGQGEDLQVQQWWHGSATYEGLHLTAPDGASISDVTVVAGDREVTPKESATGLDATFDPVSEVYLVYQLVGGLDRDGDRALATTPVVDVVGSAAPSQQTVGFTGATVLSLACQAAADAVAVPCGSETAQGWTVVPSTATGGQVLIQLDLDGG